MHKIINRPTKHRCSIRGCTNLNAALYARGANPKTSDMSNSVWLCDNCVDEIYRLRHGMNLMDEKLSASMEGILAKLATMGNTAVNEAYAYITRPIKPPLNDAEKAQVFIDQDRLWGEVQKIQSGHGLSDEDMEMLVDHLQRLELIANDEYKPIMDDPNESIGCPIGADGVPGIKGKYDIPSEGITTTPDTPTPEGITASTTPELPTTDMSAETPKKGKAK